MLRLIGFLSITLFIAVFVLQGCFKFRISDKEAQEKFRKKGVVLTTRFLADGDRNLHYSQVGSDSLPTLFFVHGSPGSWKDFSAYMEDKELMANYRMISIDRPGFGYSDFGKSLPLQEQSDQISILIRQLYNNKSFYLIGHSLGGPLVALLAADNPKYIKGILVLAGALDPALEPKEKWRPIAGAFPLRYLIPGAFRPSNKELWYLKSDLYPLKDKLNLVKCQVYIMHGQNDMLVDVKNVDYIKAEFKNASVIRDTIWKHENHFIPWTRFKEIKQVLLSWQM